MLPKQISTRLTLVIVVCTYLFVALPACKQNAGNTRQPGNKEIALLLDSFNRAAASASFDAYFNFFTPGAIFTGTDATERWNKQEFMNYAKPYFDRGKAWSFTSIERHIYFNETGTTAWFDELLKTQMKLCRGSGVLVKQDGDWKIAQYILSTTIPNDKMDSVIRLKAGQEDSLLSVIQSR